MKKWPDVGFRKWKAKAHTTVEASTKMQCGYEIKESFRAKGKDEQEAYDKAKRASNELARLRARGHLTYCKDCAKP